MENNNIFTKMSILTLNKDNPISECLNIDNTVKSNDLDENQKKFNKNDLKLKKNYNYRKISHENKQFQLFGLDTNKLRQIFLDHGESMIKWKNNNSSMKNLEENDFID